MTSSTADDKRRRQNRESQRRYRKRQRMDLKNPDIDILQNYLLRPPMNRDHGVPCSTTPTLWAGDSLDSRDQGADVFPGNRIVRDFQDVEASETSILSQSCDSTQTRHSTSLSSMSAADFLSIQSQTSDNGHANTDPGPASYMTKDRDSQQFDLVQTASTSRLGQTPSPVTLPFVPEGYNPQIVWNTPPNSAHGTLSGGERLMMNPGHENRPTRRASVPQASGSRTPKVNSRAVQMITEVENLYEFGVNIGILPEARDTKRMLNRMKYRFMSLSLSASTDGPDSALARSTDEDEDSDSC